MKELDPTSQDKMLVRTEIQAEQEKKVEFKLIGQQRVIPGLTLWEYNTKRQTLSKATFKKQDVVLTTLDPEVLNNTQTSHRVEVNENCVYIQALNMKTAIKKLVRNKLV